MASGTIKGITIEIEGKTSGLVKSLGNVNKALSETQKSLRTVEKALKLDPKNLDTLKTKQSLLNQAIKETEEKLKLEKQAADDAAKALQEGTITQNQYNTLQAEVAKTTAELSNLKNEAEATNTQINQLGSGASMQKFSDQLKVVADGFAKVGEKCQEIGEALTKTVTVAVGAAAAASVKMANDLDEALDNIAIATGATGEALDDMRDRAESIANTIPTDFETAADAVGAVNTRFGETGDQLEELSTAFVKFSRLNNTNVVDSVNDVQKAMKAFNLDTKDATKVLDAITAAGQKYGVSASTIQSSLTQNAATFQQMGMSIADATDFLGKCETSGIEVTDMMSGLQRAMKTAASDGKSISEALAEVQNKMSGTSDETEALNAAYDLFGRKGANVYQAIKNGTIDFRNLTKASKNLGDSIGTVDKTYENLEDGAGTLKVAQNNLKSALGEVGSTLGETLAPIIKKVSELLRGFANWWKSLSPPMQKVILAITGIVAAIGPLLIFIGKVAAGISALITVFSAATGGMAAMGAGLTAMLGPIAAVAAAIGAVILVIKNWDDIMELVGIAWDAICEGIKTAFEAVWNFFVDGFTAIGELAETICTNIGEFFSACWEGIVAVWSAVKDWFSGIFQGAYDAVVGIWEGIKSFFTGVWEHIVNTFSEIGVAIYDAITGVVKGALNALLSGAVGIINGFVAAINGVVWIINLIPGVDIDYLDYLDVPQLAKGGVLKKGQVGLLEGNGAEAVVPLDQNQAWVNAVAKQMAQSQAVYGSKAVDYTPILTQIADLVKAGQTTKVSLQVGGAQFGQAVINSINNKNYRSGGH